MRIFIKLVVYTAIIAIHFSIGTIIFVCGNILLDINDMIKDRKERIKYEEAMKPMPITELERRFGPIEVCTPPQA